MSDFSSIKTPWLQGSIKNLAAVWFARELALRELTDRGLILPQSGSYDLEFVTTYRITRPDRLLAAHSTVPARRRFQARPLIDRHNPYRWAYIIRTLNGLAFGQIYRQHGDDLTYAEVNELRSNPHVEIREVESRGTAGHV